MIIIIAQNLAMGAGPVGVIPPLLCYVDPRAAQLVTTMGSDFGAVDPRAAQLVTTMGSDFGAVDPRAARLVQ